MEEASSSLSPGSFVLEEENESIIVESELCSSHGIITSEDSLQDQLSPLLDSPEAELPLPSEQAKTKHLPNVLERRRLSETARQAKLLYAERYTPALCIQGGVWYRLSSNILGSAIRKRKLLGACPV